MKCEQPMCWCCAWRHIIGPGNDPTLSCGHPSEYVRRQFRGSPTARTCKEYVEDDPRIKIKITRDTRETFMRAIHQMAVDSGHFAEAEATFLWKEHRETEMSHLAHRFLFPTAASGYNSLHMLYHLRSGGVSLKSQNLTVICSFTEETCSLMEIIQSSFQSFLKKELQDVAKWGCKTV